MTSLFFFLFLLNSSLYSTKGARSSVEEDAYHKRLRRKWPTAHKSFAKCFLFCLVISQADGDSPGVYLSRASSSSVLGRREAKYFLSF